VVLTIVQEITGDIWGYLGRAVIAITTNGLVTKSGAAVFGRGCARQAQERFPDMPLRLGKLLQEHGNHVLNLGNGLVSFPVEESPWAMPDLHLIRRSAGELRDLADSEGWEMIVVPRPGCGGGGLDWREVRPLLADFFDFRFFVITTEQEKKPARVK
jgi:hypothetical protein